MVGSRTATALVGLAASVAITVALWWAFDTLAVFLFLPFVPFLFSGRASTGGGSEATPALRACPTCGFQTRNDEFDYCPRDGRRLERRSR